VQQALDELDRPDANLTSVYRKAVRIARLRNDYPWIFLLQHELESLDDPLAKARNSLEVSRHYTREQMRKLQNRTIEESVSARTVKRVDHRTKKDEDKVVAWSIPEIERMLPWFEARARGANLPEHLTPLEVALARDTLARGRAEAELMVLEMRGVRERLAQRVHHYLSRVESGLYLGQQDSDILEQNRQYVDQTLGQVAPEALEQIVAAYRRVRDGTVEGRTHALTSCRRALKSLADRLYPARDTPVIGSDGKPHKVTEDRYIARLWQYVHEKVKNAAARDMFTKDVEDLGSRVDDLNDLASKGVHAQVTEFEVNLCVSRTYLLMSDFLRLHTGQSDVTGETGV
jgi:predicted subunit of tRNA(5-methylaminomethyl-2-thiouridylate) methyltransferase